MAKLTFYGATEGVTGSAYLIETEHATILLECGLSQGSRQEEKLNKKPIESILEAGQNAEDNEILKTSIEKPQTPEKPTTNEQERVE